MNEHAKPILVAVLGVLLLLVLGWNLRGYLPGSGSRDRIRRQLSQLEKELAGAQAEAADVAHSRARLRQLAGRFWPHAEGAVGNAIREQVEQSAQESGLKISRLGLAQIVDVGESLQAVDIRVDSLPTDLRCIARFLRVIENANPVLHFTSCEVWVSSDRNGNELMFSGTVRGFLFKPAAAELVEGLARK